MYEQLDEVDVSQTVQNGLAILSDSINDLVDGTPALSEGLQIGQQALNDVEDHLPQLEDGRLWVEAQASRLGSFYETVELVLQGVLDSMGTFLDLVENWFGGIRKWLPFGIDEKAADVVTALSDLVAETPQTISGLDTFISKPLDEWLSREEGVPRLQKTLVNPIRHQVLAEANETISRAQTVKSAYHDHLASPVEATVSSRDAVRLLIAEYRQQYQV